MKINGSLLFSLGLVLLLAFLTYVTLGYNQLARLVPLVVLVPGLIFAVAQFGFEVRNTFFTKKDKAAQKAEEKETEELAPRERLRREWVAVGWLLSFLAMILFLGQLIAIPLFVLAFTRFFGRESWRLSIVFAIMCWVFVYGVFTYALRIELWPGILPPLFEQ